MTKKSKKFVSLIRGDALHVAPHTKIISSQEYTSLLDAENLLETIKKDAEEYRKKVVLECEGLKEQAEKAGYEQGFQKWAEQIAKLEAEIATVRKDMEKLIFPVALKAAKKIVGREMETSETAMVDIVANSLKAVSTHKKITIYVNKKDLEVLEKHKPTLKNLFENLESFVLRERTGIDPGGCVIETEAGIINARLENQWRTLEKAFENLAKTT